jgi:hypothetical protein
MGTVFSELGWSLRQITREKVAGKEPIDRPGGKVLLGGHFSRQNCALHAG